MSAPVIYAILLIVTIRKFGFSLLCTYKLPLVSWIIESLLNITAGILYFSNASSKTTDKYLFASYMAALISWTAFYVTMFRLKKLMIYMDIQNETQIDIERQLKRMRMLYTILISTIVMTVAVPFTFLLITEKNHN